MRYPRTLCSIQVNNPGGSSGGGTVQTDGVTIQGDGSGANKIAIKQVETDASLTGAGTVASPLSVASLNGLAMDSAPVQPGIAGGAFAFGPDKLILLGYWIFWPVTVAKIVTIVGTGDAVNASDVGIYSTAGSLLAHTGPIVSAATGIRSVALTGSITMSPGRYLFAWTTHSSTLTWDFAGAISGWFFSSNYTATSAGTLPNSITAPTLAFPNNQNSPYMMLSP